MSVRTKAQTKFTKYYLTNDSQFPFYLVGNTWIMAIETDHKRLTWDISSSSESQSPQTKARPQTYSRSARRMAR